MGRSDVIICNKLLAVIKKKGDVHVYDLIDEVNITIGRYYSIKPYFEHKYAEWIKYDKPTKTWSLLNKDIQLTEQKTLGDEVREENK